METSYTGFKVPTNQRWDRMRKAYRDCCQENGKEPDKKALLYLQTQKQHKGE